MSFSSSNQFFHFQIETNKRYNIYNPLLITEVATGGFLKNWVYLKTSQNL